MSDDMVALLRARLDEEEAAAKRLAEDLELRSRGGAWGSSGPQVWGNSVTFITAWTPERVLREVEAKRDILDDYAEQREIFATAKSQRWADDEWLEYLRIKIEVLEDVVATLAAIYREEP